MLWQYARASYFFRVAVVVGFWALLPGTLGITTYFQVHRRLQGYYLVKATVIERVLVGSELEPCVRVEYHDINHHVQHVDLSLSTPEEHSLAPGNEVPVCVSIVQPSEAWFTTHGKPGYRGVGIAAVLTMLLWVPALLALLRAWRRSAIVRYAQPLTGRVERVIREKPSHIRSPYDYSVVYAYTTPAGISYERRSARMQKSLADRWRRRAELPVYFDPEHPERAEADVYEFRSACSGSPS